MKLKKGILLTALTLVSVSIIGAFSSVQAATATTPITLNLNALRSSGQGYKVTNYGEKQIWKIYNTKNNVNQTYYCIRGGPGFGSGTMGNDGSSISATDYKVYFDMKDPDSIGNNTSTYGKALSNFLGTSNYNKLMWVLDQCYVQPITNASDTEKTKAAENKKALLDAVEEYVAEYPGVYDNTSALHPDKLTDNLTDDDIDAIQQLAVWHFTNNGDNEYDIGTGNPSIKINSVLGSDGNYTNFNLNDNEDASRMHAMDALYAYLVNTAEEKGSYDYRNADSTTSPVEIVKTNNITTEISGDRLIIGPYKINELKTITYTLEGSFTDGTGNTITDIKYLENIDNIKNEVASGTTLKDLVGSNFYISIPATTDTSKITLNISGSFFATNVTYWSVENPGDNDQPIVQIEKINKTYADSIDYEYVVIPEKSFDLALRKFIYSVNGAKLTGDDSREPVISNTTLQELANGGVLTTEKVHTKSPLVIKTGDRVVYTIRVYNEGEVDGWATEITDYLPSGLKLVPTSESTINDTYGWTSTDGKRVTTSYLSSTDKKLTAFNKETLALDYKDIQIECEVIATVKDTDQIANLTNIAEITAHKDIDGNTSKIDRDSEPGNVTTDPEKYNPKNPTKGTGEQDDDDYEKLILPGEYFDLSLRKFITTVTNPNRTTPTIISSREPAVNTSTLISGASTTAIYNHTKEPVGVSNGDIVTYTIRVYNEGKLDGYVTEITDHLPSQLEFIVDDELNAKYGWTVSSDGRTVKTDITSPKTSYSASRDIIYADRTDSTDKVLLKAFDGKEGTNLDYIDVQIRCKVKDNINLYEKITNIADITGFTDSEGNVITDRDSQKNNVTLPTDSTLPEYKDSEIESGKEYIPGQQDDDDFEKLVLQRFDLALRKFITGVANGETTTDITNRAPVFKKVSETEYTYEHTKEPVDVANSNIVIYTLRIFNEGNVDGYATKIKDDIPDGLEFLPDNSINTAFGWKMYKEDGTETTDVLEASYIETDFLSKKNEKTDGDNLIKAFDPDTMTMPNYKDIKVAFKVTEPNTSDRIIINQAQISDDSDKNGEPVDDVDSKPNEWNDGEDDQDIEKIKVKYFDLSLKKWVTESIVTYNGKTTVTKSGHTGDEDPEAPMKVEIQTANIKKTTVKFRFNIKVTNEGEIAGYAKEIIDYIPDGLKFVAEDNPKWTVSEDGRVTTDQLKDKLLQPGESATVDIVLTWINGKDNMGEKVNWAEISKDYNEYNSPDIDSTPGNNVKGEDDIDQAPVLLSPATGSVQTYMTLILSCISIIAGGIILIKKFVL